MVERNQPGSGEWKHDLFSCCENCGECLTATFCGPCYAYCTATAAGESNLCGIIAFCFPIALCCVRSNVRERKGIDGSPVGDFCVSVFCGCCSAIQIKREFTE